MSLETVHRGVSKGLFLTSRRLRTGLLRPLFSQVKYIRSLCTEHTVRAVQYRYVLSAHCTPPTRLTSWIQIGYNNYFPGPIGPSVASANALGIPTNSNPVGRSFYYDKKPTNSLYRTRGILRVTQLRLERSIRLQDDDHTPFQLILNPTSIEEISMS